MKTESEYEKLDPTFKAKWIEALRSGNYKQGSAHLYHSHYNHYCCLGVACVVSGMKETDLRGFGYVPHSFKDVPPQLRGLTNVNTTPGRLSRMNDNENMSFPEIADWIEENL